jgi:hypothetical protein
LQKTQEIGTGNNGDINGRTEINVDGKNSSFCNMSFGKVTFHGYELKKIVVNKDAHKVLCHGRVVNQGSLMV